MSQSYHALSVLEPERQAPRCEFCGSAQLVPYEQTKESFRPESVLPFKVADDKARDGIRSWYGKLWLAPNALKRRALTDTVKGIYLPYWTFDAHVDATWTAEAGHYYYTTESYTDNNGHTQTRQAQHVRWEPAAGWLLSYTFGAKAFQAAMNGVSGAIEGEYPKSWIKVTLLVLGILVALSIVLWLGSH